MSELFVLGEVKNGNNLMTGMAKGKICIWAQCRIMSKRSSKSRLNRHDLYLLMYLIVIT